MGAAKTTIDHEEIRRWVEQHGGHPATVRRTRSKDNAGIIRVDFPGFSGEDTLEAIDWDEWFQKFDEQQLAFLYQQGKNTNFNKLVRRDPEQVRPSDRRRGPSRTTRGGRAAARALVADARRGGRSSAQKERSSDGARERSGGARSQGAGERSGGARSQGTGERSGGARSQGTRARSSGSATEGTRARGNGARAKSTVARSNGARSEGARTRGSDTRPEGRRSRSVDLASQTKSQLYERARKAGIERSSTMNKPELIRALERVRVQSR